MASLLNAYRLGRSYIVCVRCYKTDLTYSHTARYAVNTLRDVQEMVDIHRTLDSRFGSTRFKPVFNTNVMVFDRNNKLVKWRN